MLLKVRHTRSPCSDAATLSSDECLPDTRPLYAWYWHAERIGNAGPWVAAGG